MTSVPVPEPRERLAAVDVGSNSIRLLVAEYGPQSGLSVIAEVKEQPRLATGITRTRRLDPEAMERAIAGLKRMRDVCERRGVSRIAAVATAAVREAINGPEFVSRAKRRRGSISGSSTPKPKPRSPTARWRTTSRWKADARSSRISAAAASS